MAIAPPKAQIAYVRKRMQSPAICQVSWSRLYRTRGDSLSASHGRTGSGVTGVPVSIQLDSKQYRREIGLGVDAARM